MTPLHQHGGAQAGQWLARGVGAPALAYIDDISFATVSSSLRGDDAIRDLQRIATFRAGAVRGSRPDISCQLLERASQSFSEQLFTHVPVLSFGPVAFTGNSASKGLGNVRKVFGELRNV